MNQNTILHVYERLTAEGWLETRQGSGTYVKSNPATGHKKAQTQALLAQLRRAAQQALLLGITPEELHTMLDQSMHMEMETESKY